MASANVCFRKIANPPSVATTGAKRNVCTLAELGRKKMAWFALQMRTSDPVQVVLAFWPKPSDQATIGSVIYLKKRLSRLGLNLDNHVILMGFMKL